MKQWFVIYVLGGALIVGVCGQSYAGDSCRAKNGKFGTCLYASQCEEAVKIISAGGLPQVCGYNRTSVIVCCANPDLQASTPPLSTITRNSKCYKKCELYARSVTTLIQVPALLVRRTQVKHTECGMQTGSPLITGGERCRPKEFPHMALLGFGPQNAISWECGGSLISPNYILTAAHCVTNRGRMNVSWALLGDLNITSIEDNEFRLVEEVVERIRHPLYKQPAVYNDIALLRLKNNVKLTAGVRPACIHHMETSASLGLVATVTGWGKTVSYDKSGSDVLLKADLRFVDTVECNSSYTDDMRTKNLRRGIDGDTMLCAGDPNRKKDTCQGDSGGPLQLQLAEPYCMYGVVGVTSYGPTNCGGSKKPAVYTRVSHFRTWIEDIVWPN